MKKQGKKEVEERIAEFFEKIESKTSEEIRKIKRLAMHHKIRLGAYRKKFCKYCFSPKLKVLSIKNKVRRVMCGNCRKISRWRI